MEDRDILSLLQMRKTSYAKRYDIHRRVRDMVNGDLEVPLPEIDQSMKPAVANLAALGLDGISQRIASTNPIPQFPVLREGIQASIQDARDRRDVVSYWWDEDRMDLKLGLRARHFSGYAASLVMLRPGVDRPMWVLRDTLTSYPAEGSMDDPCVSDCVFEFQRPWAWLAKNYGMTGPTGYSAYDVLRPAQTLPGDMFSLVEYCDDKEWVLLCTGKSVNSDPAQRLGSMPVVRLERIENRIGMCPVASAGRLTLDRPQGQFDGVLGLYWQQSAMSALDVIAVRRGIFANEWLEGDQPGVQPKVLVEADGLRGITGVVQNGRIVTQNLNPGYKTGETLDRLERSLRLTGRIPAEFGGESGSNIRTGRRGDAVLASVVDFPVQEAQRAFSRSLQYENRIAIAIDRAYYGQQSKTIWVGNRNLTYTPEVLWTKNGKPCDYHTVSYSFAGVDANSLRLSTLQSTGAGTMSKRRGMELDPLIDDVDQELNRIQIEAIDVAGMAALQQQASSGAIPVGDIGRIKQLMRSGMEWEDAVDQAQKEAQSRQATPAPQGAPEAQPGLAQPGMGAEQPTIGAAPAGGSNLAGLIGELKKTMPAGAAA